MEPDGGLIEHIQDATEIRPQLSRQPDPLTFATAQGDHTAAELQITQTHLSHELQALTDLRKNVPRDFCSPTLGAQSVKPGSSHFDGPTTHFLDGGAFRWGFTQGQPDGPRHRIQTGSLARRASLAGFSPTEPRFLHRVGIGPALHIGQVEQLAETAALQAPSLAGVVAEILRIQRRERPPAFGATAFRGMHGQEPLAIESKEGAFARFEGFLDSLDAHLGRVAGLKNTRDDFNIVFLESIESEVLIGQNQLTIGAQFMITPLTSPFGHLAVEPLAIANYWSQQLQWPTPADCLVQGGQQLLASLCLDGNSTVGALQDSQSGVQQADEVVHLGHGGHRTLATTPGSSLLDTDRRR